MKKRLKTPKGLTLDTLAEFIESRIERVEERIGLVDERIGLVEARIDKRFDVVVQKVDVLETRLTELGTRVGKIEQTTLDTLDEVAAINFALENDAKRYFDHDKRIARLEKAAA